MTEPIKDPAVLAALNDTPVYPFNRPGCDETCHLNCPCEDGWCFACTGIRSDARMAAEQAGGES